MIILPKCVCVCVWGLTPEKASLTTPDEQKGRNSTEDNYISGAIRQVNCTAMSESERTSTIWNTGKRAVIGHVGESDLRFLSLSLKKKKKVITNRNHHPAGR